MMREFKGATLAAAFAALAMAGAAHAGIAGDHIKATYFYPTRGIDLASDIYFTPDLFVVGAGVESTMTTAFASLRLDFSNSLTVLEDTDVFFLGGSGPDFFNGPIFTDLSGARFGEILSVSGLDASQVTSEGDALVINWAGHVGRAGDQIVITFADVPAPTGGVPEPASWALMVVGFGLAGGTLRRRRAVA